eukprot:TRINITY_DN54567_c0_g1_i1.p1 TRINITY_DN54567_c0_g1~~TRINITY_DN54567_c0_g1_i1.p1  ORF type:complete len:701 (-),score=121.39 TRINITY_DN54567_c0_g1_i1:76-2124(-)
MVAGRAGAPPKEAAPQAGRPSSPPKRPSSPPKRPRSPERPHTASSQWSSKSNQQPPPHPGCWGAGGWAGGRSTGGGAISSKRVGGDPEVPADGPKVVSDFVKLLLKQHHTIARAWCHLDTERRGRISYMELCRACQRLGYRASVRTLFESLDVQRTGYVSLAEVDPETAALLESLAVCIWITCGTVDAAWTNVFNKRGAHRCTAHDFKMGCSFLGFPLDVDAAYEALNADLGTTGLTRKEFGFLDLWFAPGPVKPISVLHPKAEMEASARGPSHELPKVVKKDMQAELKSFKRLLKGSYQNYVRAWREGLDRNHNGVLDFEELKKACKNIGYHGTRRALWNALDVNNSGEISLEELDRDTADTLATVLTCAIGHYGSWENAWRTCMDVKGDDRVKIIEFTKGCRAWGYAGNPEHLFELLDVDRAGYLTLDQTKWITGANEDGESGENKLWDDIGDVRISGKFKQVTQSQARKADFLERERRIRKAQFLARDRGEIPGSQPAMKAMPLNLRRSQSVASSLMPPFMKPSPKALGSIRLDELGSGHGAHGHGFAGAQTGQSGLASSSGGNLGAHGSSIAGAGGLARSSSGPARPTANRQSEKEMMSMSLSSFASMAGGFSDAEASGSLGNTGPRMVQALARSKVPSSPLAASPMSPGKGGWPSSKLGLARAANKEWRDGLIMMLA